MGIVDEQGNKPYKVVGKDHIEPAPDHLPTCAKATDGAASCTCRPVELVTFNEALARAALAAAMRHAANLDRRLKMRIQTPINFQAEVLALVQQNMKLTIMLMDQVLILATGRPEVVQMKKEPDA